MWRPPWAGPRRVEGPPPFGPGPEAPVSRPSSPPSGAARQHPLLSRPGKAALAKVTRPPASRADERPLLSLSLLGVLLPTGKGEAVVFWVHRKPGGKPWRSSEPPRGAHFLIGRCHVVGSSNLVLRGFSSVLPVAQPGS